MARQHSKPVKPADPHVMRLSVVRTERVSASFVRVTLAGDDLQKFTPMGWDQWFRLFLPQDPTTAPPLPTSSGALWWPQVLRMPSGERPHVRNYTVGAIRLAERELDVDFVIHGADVANSARTSPDGAAPVRDTSSSGSVGPVDRVRSANEESGVALETVALETEEVIDAHGVASAWAMSAQPGWQVGVLDEGIGWNPPIVPESVLIVGDETALPAIAGIARSLPSDARGRIVAEVPTADDRRELHEPRGVEVHWVIREGSDAAPGVATLAAASVIEVPESGLYVYVSGEQALAAGVRRAMVARGVPKSHITFCGYWRI